MDINTGQKLNDWICTNNLYRVNIFIYIVYEVFQDLD